MQVYIIPYTDIVVPKNRQRRYFNEVQIQELAASIGDNGLIQPLVVRREEGEKGELILVAGERRLRALDVLWGYGQEVRCGEKIIPENHVPCLFLGEIDPIDAFEIELEENIRRIDLDWKERATAVTQLYELRRTQAEKDGTPGPTPASIAEEITGTDPNKYSQDAVREDIILARNLDNPVVAKAPSRREAFKALKRSEETKRNEQLGRSIGQTFTKEAHTLLNGDCLSLLKDLPSSSFDVILTDPPYGIDAQDYGDSGGKTGGAHQYADDYHTWIRFMPPLVKELWRVTKPQAHLYMFCDVDRFWELKQIFAQTDWNVFRTPLIYVNPTAMRAPWPERGPQRKWQMILYAVKGDKNVTRLYPDVITCPSDVNLGHQAQKPVALYGNLLSRSVRPGDAVLDPFCGTGPIFPACHEYKCRATGIEMDPGAYGIAAQRLGALK